MHASVELISLLASCWLFTVSAIYSMRFSLYVKVDMVLADITVAVQYVNSCNIFAREASFIIPKSVKQTVRVSPGKRWVSSFSATRFYHFSEIISTLFWCPPQRLQHFEIILTAVKTFEHHLRSFWRSSKRIQHVFILFWRWSKRFRNDFWI